MKKPLAYISAAACSVFATLAFAVGLSHVAQKFDPVAQKAQEATSFEVADGTNLPCLPCTGGGGGGPRNPHTDLPA